MTTPYPAGGRSPSPAILDVYEKQGIRNGAPNNVMKGPAFQTALATAYPDCHLVVTKETMSVEGMIKIVYDLLKEKLNIVKLTFTSGVQRLRPRTLKQREPSRAAALRHRAERKGRVPEVRLSKVVKTARVKGQL